MEQRTESIVNTVTNLGGITVVKRGLTATTSTVIVAEKPSPSEVTSVQETS